MDEARIRLAEELLREGVYRSRAAQSAPDQVARSRSQAQALEAGMARAQAEAEQARLLLSYTKIVAPADGFVTAKSVEAGAYVREGQPLLALVPREVWVVANFKETQLTHMRVGQSAEITVDAIPDRVFRGTVESFSPASGAQFAMLPPDNATGNFTKVVQRVPVHIRFDPESIRGYEDRLPAGLSTVVSVRVK